MRLSLPISPQSTSPLREAGAFVLITLALTWLFWLPGAFLQANTELFIGDLLVLVGSFVPLGAALGLEFWLGRRSLDPMRWLKTLSVRGFVVAALLPIMILTPAIIVRIYQGTLHPADLLSDARGMWVALLILFIVGLAEEIGWRAFLLPRLSNVPLYLVNLLVGFAWYIWQLPIHLVARYNVIGSLGTFLLEMLIFSILFTPFLNRLALRAAYNPILPAVTRGGMIFAVSVYFVQNPIDSPTEPFGTFTLTWLGLLNVVLFSQLWLGKKPSAQVSELERVMPLETSS